MPQNIMIQGKITHSSIFAVKLPRRDFPGAKTDSKCTYFIIQGEMQFKLMPNE